MLEEIETVLRDAFREKNQLQMFLYHKFGIRLEEIAYGENYKHLVFKVVQYFDQQDRLPELIEESCKKSNNTKLKELNHKIKTLSPSISDTPKEYKPTISKEMQQLDETDIKNLESFIKDSGKATNHNARIVLCNKVGVDSDDIDFAEQASVTSFANRLVQYLVKGGNFDGLLRLCEEIKQNFKGRLLTKIENIEAKIKIIKANQ